MLYKLFSFIVQKYIVRSRVYFIQALESHYNYMINSYFIISIAVTALTNIVNFSIIRKSEYTYAIALAFLFNLLFTFL